MFLQSHRTTSRFSARRTLAVAAVVLLTAGYATAQPQIPAGTHGYQAFLIAQDYAQQLAARQNAAARPAPHYLAPQASLLPAVTVTVAIPQQPSPAYVEVRGMDGVVRRFALEGGRDVIHVREVVVRLSQPAAYYLEASAPAK